MIIARVPSGMPGLDAVLEGGIPSNTTIALRADPSNYTECFQQQFIAEGLKHGFPALYCCLSRPVASVIKSMKLQGFDVLEQVANDQLIFLDCYSLQKRTAGMGVDPVVQKKIISVIELDDEALLQDGLATAVEKISNLKGLRAVCECVPSTLTSKNAVQIMRWGRKAFGDLRAFETVSIHTFPVGMRDDLFEAMANDFDGIMEMRQERSSDRVRHMLTIHKMRMTALPDRVFDIETENGILTVKSTQKIG